MSRRSSRSKLTMLPATASPSRMTRITTVSSAMIFAQCAAKASRFRGGNAAIWLAAGSSWCSKRIGRSLSLTSRSWTPAFMAFPQPSLLHTAIRVRLDEGSDGLGAHLAAAQFELLEVRQLAEFLESLVG